MIYVSRSNPRLVISFSFWMKKDLLVCGSKDRNILQIHFRMKEFCRKRRFSEKQKNGWMCILLEKTPIYATSAPSRINIQTGSVAAPIADSLWADDHIWRDCSPDG